LTMRLNTTYAVMVAVVMFWHPSHAWGPDGHRTVATLAEKLIAGSNAATQVRSILGNLSLADVAVWADCVKSVNPSTFQYEHPGRFPECKIFETPSGEAAMEDFVHRNATNCPFKPGEEICHKQYHYSDVAYPHQTYLFGFVGTRGDDIVAAVAATTHVLKGDPAPAPFNIKDKAEALRLLVHYVGDIHQPLHVGAAYLDAQGNEINPDSGTFDPKTVTRGGNDINVGLEKANLHATWDAIPAVLTSSHVRPAWITSARAIPATSGSDFDWPKRWGAESVAQANLAMSGLTFGPQTGAHWAVVLPAGYGARMKSIKKMQLTRAGARLAQILMDISEVKWTTVPQPTQPPLAAGIDDVNNSNYVRSLSAETASMPAEAASTRIEGQVRLAPHAGVEDGVIVVRERPSAQMTELPTDRNQKPHSKVFLLGKELLLESPDNGERMRSRVYVRDATGLQYSGTQHRFEGQIGVKFVNAKQADDRSRMARPVSVLVKAVGSITEEITVSVEELGHWYPVKLVIVNPSSPYHVSVLEDPNSPGDDVTVTVITPRLVLAPLAHRIFGYGLGKVTVNIDAIDILDAPNTHVSLDSALGQLESSSVILDKEGRGIVTLRSAGTGITQVRALEPFVAKPVEIKFASPVSFLFFAAAGGVTGAFLLRKSKQRWSKVLVKGAITAVVMVIAYAVGLNWVVRTTGWTNLADSGEAVIFILGVLGSFVGIAPLWLGSRISRLLNTEHA
jgi:hypothetical protein